MLKLSYTEFGTGAPIVIVHGLFGSSRNWTSIAKKLGESHHVLSVDLRNHGASPWSDSMDLSHMAADLSRFIDDHHLKDPIVIGHSLGGKAAMVLALTHPDKVGKLVVADIAPVTYPPELKPYIDAMRAVDLSSVSRRGEVDGLLKAVVPNPGIRTFLLQNLVSDSSGLSWRLNLEALAKGMADYSTFPKETVGRHFPGPCLFISGGKSHYVKKSYHSLIKKFFPSVQFSVIDGAGHWVHAEKPQDFLKSLEDFF